MAKLPQEIVLRYQGGRRPQETVKRHYLEWRSQQNPPVPIRCDMPDCIYFKSELRWNGKELKLILDHKNGVNGDDRPENLQLLCPNCNSQQPTHGGGNKGKVEQSEGGFAISRDDGKKDYTMPVEVAKYSITEQTTFIKKK